MDLSQIHPNAEIDSTVKIGPFCVIGPNVKIGAGCVLHSHVVIDGHTSIGENNEFYQFCSIGAPPQDLTYKGEPTEVIIGKNNVFRESVSVHRATTKENHKTVIGNNSLFMAYSHVGHDAIIGDHCIFANSVHFAGHVKIGDRVIISGGVGVSQFVRIGGYNYIGGNSGLDRDLPPFCSALGFRAKIKGINIIGLKRNGYEKKDISQAVQFFNEIGEKKVSIKNYISDEAVFKTYEKNPVLKKVFEFIEGSKVGIASYVKGD